MTVKYRKILLNGHPDVVEVEVEVEGLGNLTNTTVQGSVPIQSDGGAQPSESEEVISTAMGGDWEHRGKRAAGGQGGQPAPHFSAMLHAR